MKLLSAIITLVVLLFSCKSKTAYDYSQQIVKMETELAADIAIADKKVSQFLENDHDSAVILTQQMEELADKKLKELQRLNAPKVAEAENFKREAVRYFSYLRSIYVSFNKFTMATTDDAREAERQKLARIVDDKEEATEALQAAQQKFAAANNFRVEKVNKEKVKSEK
ncbi:MAG: hypothetical protein ACXWC7_10655 [Chitinophagaceae bacterium]